MDPISINKTAHDSLAILVFREMPDIGSASGVPCTRLRLMKTKVLSERKIFDQWDLKSDGDTPKGSFFSTPGSENSTVIHERTSEKENRRGAPWKKSRRLRS
jgi:hypothetical protein